MTQTNIDILHDYFIQVINGKNLELMPRYLSEKFVRHGEPYVGMGLLTDTSNGEEVIVQKVLPGSPADGKLREGDVILCASDSDHTWETFDELREGGLWGQGAIGTPITVWVRRGNEEKEITIVRGLVQGIQISARVEEQYMREFFKDWPDVKANLVDLMEAGDKVAFHVQYQGKNIRFERSVVWSEFGILRFQDGKIIDWQNSEEEVSLLRQLGYSIRAPEMVKV